MNNQIQKILKLNKFFTIQTINAARATYKLESPSKILMQNIYSNWLQSIYLKTHKNFPIFTKKTLLPESIPTGYITSLKDLKLDQEFEHDLNDKAPLHHTELQCNFIVDKQDIIAYFLQWQRHRKYWWSSITTTPSLFTIDDTQQQEDANSVNIVAKFPWGPEVVESVSIQCPFEDKDNQSLLSCKTTLEGAFFTLLLDGTINSSKNEVLKLHRKMAPFKISFALHYKDSNKKEDLKELATLLHHNLESAKISALLPDFTIPIEEQLKENLKIGIVYTAILSENTLTDGIFHLMSSSTMLAEQVHVADFQSYASLIFRK